MVFQALVWCGCIHIWEFPVWLGSVEDGFPLCRQWITNVCGDSYMGDTQGLCSLIFLSSLLCIFHLSLLDKCLFSSGINLRDRLPVIWDISCFAYSACSSFVFTCLTAPSWPLLFPSVKWQLQLPWLGVCSLFTSLCFGVTSKAQGLWKSKVLQHHLLLLVLQHSVQGYGGCWVNFCSWCLEDQFYTFHVHTQFLQNLTQDIGLSEQMAMGHFQKLDDCVWDDFCTSVLVHRSLCLPSICITLLSFL